MKYLGINLSKSSKRLLQRNYKTLLKEIREDINGKTTHVHELKDLILLKHQYYSKQSTDLLQSLQKSQRLFFFFAGIEKLILKCIQKLKELQIAKTTLKKKKTANILILKFTTKLQ